MTIKTGGAHMHTAHQLAVLNPIYMHTFIHTRMYLWPNKLSKLIIFQKLCGDIEKHLESFEVLLQAQNTI